MGPTWFDTEALNDWGKLLGRQRFWRSFLETLWSTFTINKRKLQNFEGKNAKNVKTTNESFFFIFNCRTKHSSQLQFLLILEIDLVIWPPTEECLIRSMSSDFLTSFTQILVFVVFQNNLLRINGYICTTMIFYCHELRHFIEGSLRKFKHEIRLACRLHCKKLELILFESNTSYRITWNDFEKIELSLNF